MYLCELEMKNFKTEELIEYLDRIKPETLLMYGVYQVEADGCPRRSRQDSRPNRAGRYHVGIPLSLQI